MLRKIFLLQVLSVIALAAPQYRLPNAVKPLRESVEITLDPAENHFNGIARLDVRIDEPQSEIWLNARDLTIQQTHIEAAGKIIPTRYELSGGEFLGLSAASPVGGRLLTLVIQYRAPLSAESSTGPYHASTGSDWYAFTTFTPTDARRAFPCFDEPRFKTPWQLSFRIRKGQRAFSNTPQISEKSQADGWKLLRFAETRPLPAEVIAFAVGPFDVWEGTPAGAKATPVRVLTARGDARLGAQAAIETKAILPRLERYTGVPYPWDKLDHIALPRSAFGAVENPGLITYNGSALLAEPTAADAKRSLAIRSIEAHELAHQWFGNLVTQASWLDVWLSEGFATWFSARTLDEEQPPDRKRLAAIANRERIMLVDDSPETRPVRLERQSREELKTVYNRVVYQKGGAILMMLENWIGSARMQRGLRDYLAAHALANATTEDLESALKAVAALDPSPVMNGYLNTTGVPRISAKVTCDGAPKVTLKRESGEPAVPVCFRTSAGQSCAVIADAPQDIPLSSCPAFLFPNAHGAGYYRMVWTPSQLAQLRRSLPRLDGAERLTLVYDLTAMRTGSKAPAIDALLEWLARDRQPEIAHAARVALGLEKEDAAL